MGAGPGKIPLPMVSETDGQRDRWGVYWEEGQGGGPPWEQPPTHSGTPPWEVHISAVLHLCTFTVATRAFKPKYMNFGSLGMIRFNTLWRRTPGESRILGAHFHAVKQNRL